MATKQKAPQYTPTKSDSYTGLLVISLFALAGGSALLYLDFSQYSKTKPPAVPSGLPKPGPVVPGGVPPVQKDGPAPAKDAPVKDAPLPKDAPPAKDAPPKAG